MGKLICEVKCRRCGVITEFEENVSSVREYARLHKKIPIEKGCSTCDKITVHDFVSFKERL